MQSYCIVENKILLFSEVKHKTSASTYWRRRTCVSPVKVELPQNFPFKMGSTIVPLVGQQSNDQANGDVQVSIALSEKGVTQNGPNLHVELQASVENPVFKSIWTTFPPGKVSLTLHVTNFGDVCDAETQKIEWNYEGMEINRTIGITGITLTRPTVFSCQAFKKITSVQTINRWVKGRPFEGIISLSLVITESPYDHFVKMRKLLEESIDTDLELVTRENNDTVKCHRAILSINSNQLEILLKRQPNMLVVRIMSHLSLECIHAFLAYIYYNDVTKIFSSTALAVQVLEPALDFKMHGLVSQFEKYFNSMENNALTANQVVQIFRTLKSSKLQELENRAVNFGDYVVGESQVDDNGDRDTRADGKMKSRNSDGTDERQRKRFCTEVRAGYSGGSLKVEGQGPSGNTGYESVRANDNWSATSSGSGSYTRRSNMVGMDGLYARVVQLVVWHCRQNNALLDTEEFKTLLML